MREKAPGACALAMAKLKLLKIPFSRNSSETPRHPRLHYFRIGDHTPRTQTMSSCLVRRERRAFGTS
jgi:hypothetical protein